MSKFAEWILTFPNYWYNNISSYRDKEIKRFAPSSSSYIVLIGLNCNISEIRKSHFSDCKGKYYYTKLVSKVVEWMEMKEYFSY